MAGVQENLSKNQMNLKPLGIFLRSTIFYFQNFTICAVDVAMPPELASEPLGSGLGLGRGANLLELGTIYSG